MQKVLEFISQYYDDSTLTHVVEVSEKFSKNTDEYLVALFHDIIEDTDIPKEQLHSFLISIDKTHLFTPIVNLTRLSSERYFEYIQRIINTGADTIEQRVKLADLKTNFYKKETLKPSLSKRYEKAIYLLEGDI